MVLFAQTWTRAHRAGGIDLTTYLAAARAVEQGQSPYSLPLAFPYVYPPFLAFALIPLSHLPDDVALAIWFGLSVAAIVWALRHTLRAAFTELRSASVTPVLAVLIGVSYPIFQSNLRNAQVNFFVVALAVAAVSARSPAGRAIGWAAAVAIKIVPAALAPFFVRRGQWRVCLVAAIVLCAACLLPGVTLGASVVPLTRDYGTSFLGGGFSAAGSAPALDFSLGGLLVRLSGVDGPFMRLLGAALPLLAAFAIDLRSRADSTGDARMLSLYLAMIPLASPKSEVHHAAFALPAAAVVLSAVWFRLDRRPLLMGLLGLAAVAYACALVPSGWSSPLWFAALVALAAATSYVVSGFSRTSPSIRCSADL